MRSVVAGGLLPDSYRKLPHRGHYKEAIASLSYIPDQYLDRSVSALLRFGILVIMERDSSKLIELIPFTSFVPRHDAKKARAYLVEGVLQRCGSENRIDDQRLFMSLLQISRALSVNAVAALVRRWADLGIMSPRRLTCLRVASLAFHREFEEIGKLLQPSGSGDLQFHPDDYRYIVQGYLGSNPTTLVPLVEQLPILAEFVPPAASALVPVVTALLTTQGTSAVKQNSFEQAQLLFSWLISRQEIPPASLWVELLRNAPPQLLKTVIPSMIAQAEAAYAISPEAIPIYDIGSVALALRPRHDVVKALSAMYSRIGVDSNMLWPFTFRELKTRWLKNIEIANVLARLGESNLPDPILQEVVFHYFMTGNHAKLVSLMRASMAKRKLKFAFEPTWRLYVESCEIMGEIDLIRSFVHPDEETHPGSTIATQLRSWTVLNEISLLRDLRKTIPVSLEDSNVVQLALGPATVLMERLDALISSSSISQSS